MAAGSPLGASPALETLPHPWAVKPRGPPSSAAAASPTLLSPSKERSVQAPHPQIAVTRGAPDVGLIFGDEQSPGPTTPRKGSCQRPRGESGRTSTKARHRHHNHPVPSSPSTARGMPAPTLQSQGQSPGGVLSAGLGWLRGPSLMALSDRPRQLQGAMRMGPGIPLLFPLPMRPPLPHFLRDETGPCPQPSRCATYGGGCRYHLQPCMCTCSGMWPRWHPSRLTEQGAPR